MTVAEAKRLGWILHDGREPKLVPFGDTYVVQRGFLSAEKTMSTASGTLYTKRIDVETTELDGWPQLKKRLLREIAKAQEWAATVAERQPEVA